MNPYELVEAEAAAAVRVRCLTCLWLAERPPEEKVSWETMLADTAAWKTLHIHAAMKKLGYTGAVSSLHNHRNGHRAK